jgi:hypothetical protein
MAGIGTEYGRAVPHIWHKKFIELDLTGDRGNPAWIFLTGTQGLGTACGLLFKTTTVKQWMSWAVSVPGDWDGTSNFIFRHAWAQKPTGDQSGAICYWTLHHWVCQDWDNPIGSKTVTQHATYTYGDEGTTNHCMHCGTFEMDLTGGTFGTVGVGNTLFMTLQMPTSVSPAGTAIMLRANVEYMANFTGPSDLAYTTQDKRGG